MLLRHGRQVTRPRDFDIRLEELLVGKNEEMSQIITPERYVKLITEVKEARAKQAKDRTTTDRRRLKRFSVIEINGEEKLIAPLKDGAEMKFFLRSTELYDVLLSCDIAVGHGGRNRMEKELKQKYCMSLRRLSSLSKTYAAFVLTKLPAKKRGVVVKPMVFKELNSRCQIDLIDMSGLEEQAQKMLRMSKSKFLPANPGDNVTVPVPDLDRGNGRQLLWRFRLLILCGLQNCQLLKTKAST